MPALEQLQRKIHTAEALESVVKTMKALAAVNVRHFEVMVEALTEYNRTIELGLQAVLRDRPPTIPREHDEHSGRLGVIIIGSDQGMCGPFSKRVVAHALEVLARMPYQRNETSIICLGARAVAALEDLDHAVDDYLTVPASVDRVDTVVDAIFQSVDAWELRPGIDDIIMFHNVPDSPHTYSPRTTRLSPLDPRWLADVASRDWESRSLPMYTVPFDELLSSLVRGQILVTIYRGIAHSVAAENASRLQAMQAAEGNIGDLLRDLSMRYQLERQNTITAEVLDIVSGFEALTDH